MFLRNFHAFARFHHGVFPVEVIHLQLDKIHIRMIGEQLVQRFGVVMHRETQVLDNAFGFLLRGPFPHSVLIEFRRARTAHVMQQVKVDVVGAQTLQRSIQARFRIFGGRLSPSQTLGGNGERIARIALNQRLAHGNFRFALMVHIGGIEIRAASLYKRVDHFLHMLDVDALLILGVSKRQTHAAKAKLRGVQKVAHRGAPCLIFYKSSAPIVAENRL